MVKRRIFRRVAWSGSILNIVLGVINFTINFPGLFEDTNAWKTKWIPAMNPWLETILPIFAGVLLLLVLIQDKRRERIFSLEDPDHDSTDSQVYAYLKRWTSLRKLTDWKIEDDLRQAARDGKLKVWGVNGLGHAEPLEPSFFKDYDFIIGRDDEEARITIGTTKIVYSYFSKQERRKDIFDNNAFYSTLFCSVQLEMIYPREIVRGVIRWIARKLVTESDRRT
jgi:hypothetical protein